MFLLIGGCSTSESCTILMRIHNQKPMGGNGEEKEGFRVYNPPNDVITLL